MSVVVYCSFWGRREPSTETGDRARGPAERVGEEVVEARAETITCRGQVVEEVPEDENRRV